MYTGAGVGRGVSLAVLICDDQATVQAGKPMTVQVRRLGTAEALALKRQAE